MAFEWVDIFGTVVEETEVNQLKAEGSIGDYTIVMKLERMKRLEYDWDSGTGFWKHVSTLKSRVR